MLEQISGISFLHLKKILSIYVRKQLIIKLQSPYSSHLNQNFICGTLKQPSLFGSNCK